MDKATAISLAAIGLTVLGLMATHLRTKSSAELRTDVELLKKQVALFWTLVEKEIGNMLHSPHREELDALIEKNAGGKLERKDIERMEQLLRELIKDSPREETAALVYLAAVKARHAYVSH